MHHEMKKIAESLMYEVECQLHDLSCVDAKELGEVVDMIKDLQEAIYYETVTKAMEEGLDYDVAYYGDKYRKPQHSKTGEPYRRKGEPYHDWERDAWAPDPNHDEREGRSHLTRKTYMEAKELHMDQSRKMQELEKYMQELTKDITEMIADASAEEKQLLKTKVSTLASKIA